MGFLDWVLGRPLATEEAHKEHLGLVQGIPVLGLDALSSAAYGPEAALTILIPIGAMGLHYVGLISLLIIAILLVVFMSYRQTIGAYPDGGGSYTVAKENLGTHAALLAGAALAIDYVLNVAVGISAGVGALVSAIPALLPYTLTLTLAILVLLTVINLRGLRESGFVFMLPTYAFVAFVGAAVLIGFGKSLWAGGHPVAATPLPQAMPVEAVSLWILVRAFASGCTAMTGVEAVSNAVPIFRAPAVPVAQRTLTGIIAILVLLLGGIAYLCHAYGIVATEPGQAGYQSVLSMLIGAVCGRGLFYYLAIGSIVAVLCLSANTSFADFPRLCRVLAQDRFMPGSFAVRGRRLVFSHGIILLAVLSGALLVVFGGITDRLIPLFAIGAFLAFTLSQAGMVQHWRRCSAPGARVALLVNALGALATGTTLVVVAVSKFAEGAWLTIVVTPLLLYGFLAVNRHYRTVGKQISIIDPIQLPRPEPPIVVVAAGSWNRLTQQGLRFALRLSKDIYVVQVRTERDSIELLADNWGLLIAAPLHAAGLPEPKLEIITSSFRQFLSPFVEFVVKLERENPQRDIVVVIPDLVVNHWYENILHNNRGAFLRSVLRTRCSRVVIVNTPLHLAE
jgi:amino acid transporter